MAAISVTASNVLWSSGGEIVDGTFGGTVTQGMACYADSSGNYVAGSNAAAATANIKVIALSGGSAGQPGKFLKPGTQSNPARIAIGGTVSVGKIYALGTSGAIIPVDDITSGVYATVIGVGETTSVLIFNPTASGVAAAADVT